MAATANSSRDNALTAFHRRLLAHRKATTARKAIVIVYNILKTGEPYREQGAHNSTMQQHKRRLAHLSRQAALLGFKLIPDTSDAIPSTSGS